MNPQIEITPEQQEKLKKVNKLGRTFMFRSILNGGSHAVMLCLVNVILTMSEKIFDLPQFVNLFGSVVLSFMIIRRMLLIHKDYHDIFVEEANKILESK